MRLSCVSCEPRLCDYRLGQCIKLVQEALFRHERTLGNEGRAVDIICVMLKDTVPMLQKKCVKRSWHTTAKQVLTIEVAKSRSVLVNSSMTLIENSAP
jgi:hypothetical protein